MRERGDCETRELDVGVVGVVGGGGAAAAGGGGLGGGGGKGNDGGHYGGFCFLGNGVCVYCWWGSCELGIGWEEGRYKGFEGGVGEFVFIFVGESFRREGFMHALTRGYWGDNEMRWILSKERIF